MPPSPSPPTNPTTVTALINPSIPLPKPPQNPDQIAPLKILCLHGYTQSGPQFSSKTGALRKALSSALSPRPLQFSYPTAPLRLHAADIPGYKVETDGATETEAMQAIEAYGWWRRRGNHVQTNAVGGQVVYSGLGAGLDVIASCILAEGPFDGVIGFSQGACAAGMVASLLDGKVDERRVGFAEAQARAQGRRKAHGGMGEDDGGFGFPDSFLRDDGEVIQGPLRFVVMYSGFAAPGTLYAPFWKPQIAGRSLHVLGGLDTVVGEERSLMLVGAFEEEGRVVVNHPGGHFVPSGKVWLNAVVGFVKGCF